MTTAKPGSQDWNVRFLNDELMSDAEILFFCNPSFILQSLVFFYPRNKSERLIQPITLILKHLSVYFSANILEFALIPKAESIAHELLHDLDSGSLWLLDPFNEFSDTLDELLDKEKKDLLSFLKTSFVQLFRIIKLDYFHLIMSEANLLNNQLLLVGIAGLAILELKASDDCSELNWETNHMQQLLDFGLAYLKTSQCEASIFMFEEILLHLILSASSSIFDQESRILFSNYFKEHWIKELESRSKSKIRTGLQLLDHESGRELHDVDRLVWIFELSTISQQLSRAFSIKNCLQIASLGPQNLLNNLLLTFTTVLTIDNSHHLKLLTFGRCLGLFEKIELTLSTSLEANLQSLENMFKMLMLAVKSKEPITPEMHSLLMARKFLSIELGLNEEQKKDIKPWAQNFLSHLQYVTGKYPHPKPVFNRFHEKLTVFVQ
ncbi:hypothetical protein Ciccas_003668 [Cichlidogyrus casuarinus]|uniref:Uncharacterized protein n=1 Tax=Cichlidogyrus casuarinus TaxID=1844966 RepID=A0ABD2QDP4_9PLAT